MYEELVKTLQNMSKMGTMYGMAAVKMREAADAIEELIMIAESNMRSMNAWADAAAKAAEQIPEWTPVSKRPPEKFENVIAANKRGQHYDIDKAWWNGSFFDRCGKGGYHNVTHWMPMPKPPKEET